MHATQAVVLWSYRIAMRPANITSAVFSINAPVAVDACNEVRVGNIFIASSGWTAIMLAPKSSIRGISSILFLLYMYGRVSNDIHIK